MTTWSINKVILQVRFTHFLFFWHNVKILEICKYLKPKIKNDPIDVVQTISDIKIYIQFFLEMRQLYGWGTAKAISIKYAFNRYAHKILWIFCTFDPNRGKFFINKSGDFILVKTIRKTLSSKGKC